MLKNTKLFYYLNLTKLNITQNKKTALGSPANKQKIKTFTSRLSFIFFDSIN